MPTVSDYWVLHDGFFMLELSDQNSEVSRVFRFGGVNDIFVEGTNRAKPILQFKLRAFNDNSRLVIAYRSQPLDQSRRIVTNDDAFFDREFDRSSVRTHYTFLNGATLADHQQVVFQINADGSDRIQIADPVLFYQVKV
jgi:hypothetical protein